METLQIRRPSAYGVMRATKTMLSLGMCPATVILVFFNYQLYFVVVVELIYVQMAIP